MKAKPNPSQDLLHRRFHYNHLTGIFTWKNPNNSSFLDKIAGRTERTGYIRILVSPFGTFGAHRLAWIYFHGEYDPSTHCIDHIDLNPSNNAISNLRLATLSQNQMNSRTRSRTGVKGVELLPNGRYRARIYPFGPGGGKIELGCFEKLIDAVSARMVASKQYFGEFSREDNLT